MPDFFLSHLEDARNKKTRVRLVFTTPVSTERIKMKFKLIMILTYVKKSP